MSGRPVDATARRTSRTASDAGAPPNQPSSRYPTAPWRSASATARSASPVRLAATTAIGATPFDGSEATSKASGLPVRRSETAASNEYARLSLMPCERRSAMSVESGASAVPSIPCSGPKQALTSMKPRPAASGIGLPTGIGRGPRPASARRPARRRWPRARRACSPCRRHGSARSAPSRRAASPDRSPRPAAR